MSENYITSIVDEDSGIEYEIQDAGAREDISELKSQISLLSNVPTAVKNALDTLLQNVAFKNADLYTDELAVVHNWATAVNLISISAVFEQGENVIYDRDSLDTLKQYLTVTATYDNGVTETLADSSYVLSGTLSEGTSTVTVTYSGKSTTFNVTVTEYVWTFSIDGIVSGLDTNGTDTSIGTTANSSRAVTNPLMVKIPAGTYAIQFPSVCRCAGFMYTDTGATPSFDSIDWTTTSSAKNYWSGSGTSRIWNAVTTGGWNVTSGSTFEVTEDAWILLHFQANSGTISSDEWKNTVLAGLSITEVES